MSGLATAKVRPPRRYDIDWLRIGAVLLLIPFHTARVFNVGEAFYAKNGELSTSLERFIVFVRPWHMGLLFFLAGAASWFALGFRSSSAYLGERAKRLLVPFLFGLVVLVPPQAYLGMLTNTGGGRSWWGGYARYWTDWSDPEGYGGAWTPAHLWFILFLLIYSLLALALFVWLNGARGRRLIGRFASACRLPGVVIVVPALLLLIEKAVVPMDDLSGQTPVGFFLLFVLGFVLVADDRLTVAVDRHWKWVLPLGLAAMAARAGLWPNVNKYPDGSWQDTVVNWLVYQLGVWMMIIGLLGLCHRYANSTNLAYRYATEGAYPFYVLHQTAIVLLAYWIVQWNIAIPAAFALIALAAVGTTLLVYELAVRRWRLARILFGMKDRNRSGST